MAGEPVTLDRGERRERWLTGRHVTVAFLILVLAVLALKLGGFDNLDDNVDVTSVILIALAIVLGFAALAPEEAREVINRITSLKFGNFEIGLQAAVRVERVQSRVAELIEDVNGDDDVQASTPRPVGGSAAEEFDAVRAKLTERLRYIRDVILELKPDSNSIQVVDAIAAERLLVPDESQVVRDLLGDAKDEVDRLRGDVREKYLEGAWRFASRFGTLVFERRVRKEMVEKNWFLLDFNQTRNHRPDFLAYRDEKWLLVATRVEPGLAEDTRKRLAAQTVPFGAVPAIIHPDKRADKAVDLQDGVRVLSFSDVTSSKYRRWII
jgi:hypothetical protein